jgi:hypothetical protein
MFGIDGARRYSSKVTTTYIAWNIRWMGSIWRQKASCWKKDRNQAARSIIQHHVESTQTLMASPAMVSLSQFLLGSRPTPVSVFKLEGSMANLLQTSSRDEEYFPTIGPPQEFLKRLEAAAKEETLLSTNTDANADKGSFAACLILRDDNHY